MEGATTVMDAFYNRRADYYVRYVFNEYSESRIISDASDNSIVNMAIQPAPIWQRAKALLKNSVHMAIFE